MASVTASSGRMLSPPIPVSWKNTCTPPTGTLLASVTWNVSTDCSGNPDCRTPTLAGAALTKWIELASIVGVGDAVGVGVGLGDIGFGVDEPVGVGVRKSGNAMTCEL